MVRVSLALALLVATCLAPAAGAAAGMPVKGSCCCDQAGVDDEAPDAPAALHATCCCSFEAPPARSPAAAQAAPPLAARDPLPPATTPAAPLLAPALPRAAHPGVAAAAARASPRPWTLLHQHVALLR